MSPMVQPTKNRRPRRQFDDEFKAGAVRLVLDEDRSVGQVVRDLDLTESALRNWVERARADRTQGRRGLTTEEREELRRLRKENRRLRVERDVLKKAAAFFARESEAPGQPHRHIAASNEGLVIGRPVRNAVLRLIRGMDLRLHSCSVAPAKGHEKCPPPQGLHATTPPSAAAAVFLCTGEARLRGQQHWRTSPSAAILHRMTSGSKL